MNQPQLKAIEAVKLIEHWNADFRKLATQASKGEPSAELQKKLVHFCAFICWSEFRRLYSHEEIFGRRGITNYLVSQGYDESDVNEFIDYRIQCRADGPRGDKGKKKPQHWWKLGTAQNWLTQHGYDLKNSITPYYWQDEITHWHEQNVARTDLARSYSIDFNYPFDRPALSATRFWKDKTDIHQLTIPESLQRMASGLATDLTRGTCNCMAHLSGAGTKRERSARQRSCEFSHHLTSENLAKAEEGKLPYQQKPIGTPVQYIERAIVENIDTTITKSKSKWMFFKYFTTPRGSTLAVQLRPRARGSEGSQMTLQVVERDRTIQQDEEFPIAELCRESVVDVPVFPVARAIMSKGERLPITSKPVGEIAGKPVEFGMLDADDVSVSSRFQVEMNRCPNLHLWTGRGQCPVCKAKPTGHYPIDLYETKDSAKDVTYYPSLQEILDIHL